MVTEIWVNIGSGNGLLPDGTKPSPEPMLTWSSVKSSDINIREISQEMPQPSTIKIHLKITYIKFHSNFPGANELNGDKTNIYNGWLCKLEWFNCNKIVYVLKDLTQQKFKVI